jgi:3-oxoacid CoA-transferase subunit B
MARTREEMAQIAALELEDGNVVNLGIGIPTLVANYIPEDRTIWLHSENGLLGMGPFPYEGEEDPKIINAGKQTVTVTDGGSFFDSSTSFAMIRGGHLDVAILGAMEVSAKGDLANWMIPGKKVNGMGGAMDLVSGAKRVVVVMSHTSKNGDAKLVADCALPLTGTGCVDRVITDMATLDIEDGAFKVVALADDVSLEALQAATGAPIIA